MSKAIPFYLRPEELHKLPAGGQIVIVRAIKPQPELVPAEVARYKGELWWRSTKCEAMLAIRDMHHFGPFGQPGDVLMIKSLADPPNIERRACCLRLWIKDVKVIDIDGVFHWRVETEKEKP